jgi:hypothetical protein
MVVENAVIAEHLLEVLGVGAAGFCHTCPALALAFAMCYDFCTIVPPLATAGARSAASSGGGLHCQGRRGAAPQVAQVWPAAASEVLQTLLIPNCTPEANADIDCLRRAGAHPTTKFTEGGFGQVN